MATYRSAAVSHVGKIRSNNQDSGYAGNHLFVVADGMGGHAGGDVASAIAVKRIAETDKLYTSPNDAEFALQSAVLAANSLIAETVFDHAELTGMGTTVSGILRVGDHVALAHIGDSRIYRWRDGQARTDHQGPHLRPAPRRQRAHHARRGLRASAACGAHARAGRRGCVARTRLHRAADATRRSLAALLRRAEQLRQRGEDRRGDGEHARRAGCGRAAGEGEPRPGRARTT